MTPRETTTWEVSVGFLPHKVTVRESPERDGTLYLWWRAGGNWKKKSLRRKLRTARGRIDAETEAWAKREAEAQYARNVRGEAEPSALTPRAPLTLAEGLAKATDRATGKYPTDTMHRREVVRELERATERLGASAPWESIKKADLRRLWRWRIQQLRAENAVGLRGAEVTIARVLAVAAWLRDEELIPAGACVAPRTWKQDLRADWVALTGSDSLPEPERPRHTLAEMRAIMAAADRVDPRLALALALGAELRLGQVLRCRRSDLDLTHRTLTVRTRGEKKKGVVVELTEGQVRVAEHALTRGYLRALERHAADYPLFPAGQMPGIRTMVDPVATVARHAGAKPIARSVLDGWFHEAERAAGITPEKGRAAYGLRRAAVDAVKAQGISREGLKAHGGWSDTQVPDRIYADQEATYAREEARAVRAKIRGEDARPESAGAEEGAE